MESLESKLDRLSPEQRREIEDFVDFLLSRSGQVILPPRSLPIQNVAPPPLTVIEPAHVAENRPLVIPDTARSEEVTLPITTDEPATAQFHEIGGGPLDRITHDYMDYGQFEQQPSPAADAVTKVRRKMISREGKDKPHHLLDWVD